MSNKIYCVKALKDNFIYVVQGANRGCLVIDPGETEPVSNFLKQSGLKLESILITHHHHDHVDGVIQLKNQTNCEVICSRFDKERIPGVTKTLEDGQTFSACGFEIKTLALPGHTMGQISFYVAELNAVFTGDTVFGCGCGRLFEGTAMDMWNSIRKLGQLPAGTEIYFGHEYTRRNIEFVRASLDTIVPNDHAREDWQKFLDQYENRFLQRMDTLGRSTPTSIADEILVNPFFRAQNVEEFKVWRLARDTW